MTPAVFVLALAVLADTASMAGQTPEQAFLAGVAAFRGGDYAAAERQFAACRRALGGHPAIDFNLALTYLRLEQPGQARVYAERTVKQTPRDRGARELLRQVLARLDQANPPSPSGLHALWDGLKTSVTCTEATNAAALLFFLAALAVGGWLLTERRALGWAGLVACLLAVPMWSLAAAKMAEKLAGERAIVVADSAALRGGPGEEFAEIARLSEGSTVTLLARPRLRLGPGLALRLTHGTQGLWCEVKAPSGARGYIRKSLIEIV